MEIQPCSALSVDHESSLASAGHKLDISFCIFFNFFLFCFLIGRAIEDHELVMEVQSNWVMEEETKLYFRKNYAKYEFFKNPLVSPNFLSVKLLQLLFLKKSF